MLYNLDIKNDHNVLKSNITDQSLIIKIHVNILHEILKESQCKNMLIPL